MHLTDSGSFLLRSYETETDLLNVNTITPSTHSQRDRKNLTDTFCLLKKDPEVMKKKMYVRLQLFVSFWSLLQNPFIRLVFWKNSPSGVFYFWTSNILCLLGTIVTDVDDAWYKIVGPRMTFYNWKHYWSLYTCVEPH